MTLLCAFRRLKKLDDFRFNQSIRYLTFFMAVGQATALTIWLARTPTPGHIPIPLHLNLWFFIATFLSLISGAMFVMWLAEEVTMKGIGSGLSLFILLGVFEKLPRFVKRFVELPGSGELSVARLDFLIASVVVVAALTICLASARRKIALSDGKDAFVSLKLVPWGIDSVLAVALAGTFLGVALDLTDFMRHVPWAMQFREFLQRESLGYSFIATGCIAFNCIFVNGLCVDSREIAKRLQMNRGTITGVRPGKWTVVSIDWVFDRVNFGGAICALAICVLPDCVGSWCGMPISLVGVWVFLITNVTLDIIRQIEVFCN